MANCGADTEANRLLGVLTTDAVFPIPNPDLSGIVFPTDLLNTPIVPLKVSDITDGTIAGPGAFDTLMRAYAAHLSAEFEANRITGDDYTKAYIALTESAMSQSIAFLMGKDQAFWSALLVQVQAFTGNVQLEIAKIEVAATQYNAAGQKAAYAKTKMEVATEEVTYCTGMYTLDNILPSQLAKLNLEQAGQTIANNTATYNLATMLPQQLNVAKVQEVQIRESAEAQRAQTTDLRIDGFPVMGVLGKQKDLYAQQITSYQRDAELKAARIWSDAWITQKTIDEGLLPPDTLTNANVNLVLEQIRTNNNL